MNNLEKSKGDIRKTWKLINEQSSRQCKTSAISEIKIGDHSVTNAEEIADAFYSHFTSIGEKLANETLNQSGI